MLWKRLPDNGMSHRYGLSTDDDDDDDGLDISMSTYTRLFLGWGSLGRCRTTMTQPGFRALIEISLVLRVPCRRVAYERPVTKLVFVVCLSDSFWPHHAYTETLKTGPSHVNITHDDSRQVEPLALTFPPLQGPSPTFPRAHPTSQPPDPSTLSPRPSARSQ